MLQLNSRITGFMLAIASVLAMDSCINEEYSVKDIDTSAKILPGLTLSKDVHFDVPISTGLGTDIWEDGHIRTDSDGNYILYAHSFASASETSVCHIEQYDFPYAGYPVMLHEASLTFCLDESIISRLLEAGARLHTPVKIRLENPSNIEGALSILVNNVNDSMIFNGFELKPGINEITLDSEAFMELLMSNWRLSENIDFILTPKDGILPEPVCTISTSASLPIEIMPGQEISFIHISNIENGDISLEDIPAGIVNSHAVLSLKASVVNTIPAEISIGINHSTEYPVLNVIEGLDPIKAGSPDAPSVTEMSWKISAEYGLRNPFEFLVTAKISGNKPIPINSRYGMKFNLTSVRLENGI